MGAGTRIFCGWLHRRPLRDERRLSAGVHIAGAVFRMIFGSPVEPELQMPLSAGETTSGSALSSSPRAAVGQSRQTLASLTQAQG